VNLGLCAAAHRRAIPCGQRHGADTIYATDTVLRLAQAHGDAERRRHGRGDVVEQWCCGPYVGTITAQILDSSAPYRTIPVQASSGSVSDTPPQPACGAAVRVVYTLT